MMVPTSVTKRMGIEKARKNKEIKLLSNFVDEMAEISWGEDAMNEEERQDAPFVAMSNEEFVVYLNTEEGKKMKGLDMIRINKKRMSRMRSESEEPMEEAPKTPEYWYNEYTKYPHLYFSSEAEQKVAIAEVMEEWRTGAGRWRFALMNEAAKKIQAKWISVRPERCEVCKKEPIAYVDKYETAVCENCMNGMCKQCKVAEATPRSLTDECVGCYVKYSLPKDLQDIEDEMEWEREQRRYDWM